MTDKEGFVAMKLFLEQLYARAGNDMETLIADITLESDSKPLESGAMPIW